MSNDNEDKLAQQWYDDKTARMEAVLGKEHDMVMHAVIPYAVGGGLDLYYYPNSIAGTAIATKECCETPHEGSTNDVFDLYELVMFTRHPLDLEVVNDASTPFGKAHEKINAMLNIIARYSAQATLNPNETSEFPEAMETVGGKCLIFDAYGDTAETTPSFGLLAIIEVFRSEMNFARENGGAQLIAKLKNAGHYPYSDTDRQPVA